MKTKEEVNWIIKNMRFKMSEIPHHYWQAGQLYSSPNPYKSIQKKPFSKTLSFFLSLSLNHPLFSLLLWGVEFGFHYCLSLNHQALIINTHVSFLSSSFLLCPSTVICKHTTLTLFFLEIQPWPCPFSQSFLSPHNFPLLELFHSATIWSRQQRPSNWYPPKSPVQPLSVFSPVLYKKQNGQVGQ